MVYLFLVWVDIEIILDALEQSIKKGKGETCLPNNCLQLAVNGNSGDLLSTRAPDILPPLCESASAFRNRDGFIVSDVIDFAAKSVQSRHAIAFGFWQQHERQRQVRRAFPRDRPAISHGLRQRFRRAFGADGWQTASFSKSRITRPVFAPTSTTPAPAVLLGDNVLVRFSRGAEVLFGLGGMVMMIVTV